ncbi:MAG: TauD/TfdA dioxygenase family protein [Pseudomonadota bacterium]
MQITPQPGAGAEITGLDLARMSDAELDAVRRAYATYGLVFFRDQQLDEQAHIELARRFGTININRFFAAHPNFPEIALVTKEPDQVTNIGGGWHTDHSYDLEPAMGSILVARELPPAGGDTWFVSMYQAFDCLSAGLQATLRQLRAVHSARHVFGRNKGYHQQEKATGGRIGNPDAAEELPDAVHPVVIRHPLSGREALYVNPAFTLRFADWSAEDSAPLLAYLYQQAVRDEHIVRFRWQPGSVVFWDNRATWHFAQNDYAGLRREMHRITLDGCALEAAA